MITLSCLIPAYNEGPRIAAVLETVVAHPQIAEVIVIDDGSVDDTAEVAKGFLTRHPHLRLIRQPRNGGKTAAVATGIKAATGSHLMLLDSDLLGLSRTDLSALIAPVAEGHADVSISLRHNAPRIWRAIGIDYISGERVLPRGLLAERLDQLITLPRFGLEVFMNRLWIAQSLTIAVVRWPGVDSPVKHDKLGNWRKGLTADAKMLHDIFRTIPLPEAIAQIRAMQAMRLNPAQANSRSERRPP